MSKVFVLMVEGWGDIEEAMYPMGVFSTYEKADAHMNELLDEWEANGNDSDVVNWDVEEFELDG